jgi:cytochrome c oxidase assembly protein Cox11
MTAPLLVGEFALTFHATPISAIFCRDVTANADTAKQDLSRPSRHLSRVPLAFQLAFGRNCKAGFHLDVHKSRDMKDEYPILFVTSPEL